MLGFDVIYARLYVNSCWVSSEQSDAYKTLLMWRDLRYQFPIRVDGWNRRTGELVTLIDAPLGIVCDWWAENVLQLA